MIVAVAAAALTMQGCQDAEHRRLAGKDTTTITIDCEWGEWEKGSCSATCGAGYLTKTRKIKVDAENGGAKCKGLAKKMEKCELESCSSKPVDCVWGEWVQQGKCNDVGEVINSRVVKVEAQNGGAKCQGPKQKLISCKVDCKWGEWVQQTECDAKCGGGEKTFYRNYITKELGGKPCEGQPTKKEACNTQCCQAEWSEWELGECSRTCGGGIRIDTRKATCEDPKGKGDPLVEHRAESCNTEACPPIDCVWNDWSLGECSASCGPGEQTNTRTKAVVEANGGKTCSGADTETLACTVKECPVHCQWGPWNYGECDNGHRNVFRLQTDAQYGGDECSGLSELVETCPVHCVWGEWQAGECIGGSRTSTREKLVEEMYGGTCDGSASQTETCDECQDGNPFCETYAHYYSQYCIDDDRNSWFLDPNGRYGCRKSCGLC